MARRLLSDKDLERIVELLLEGVLTMPEIAKEFNLDPSSVSLINSGRSYKKQLKRFGVTFPIRERFQRKSEKQKHEEEMLQRPDVVRIQRSSLTIIHIISAIENKKSLEVYGHEYTTKDPLDQYAKFIIANPKRDFEYLDKVFVTLDKETRKPMKNIHNLIKGYFEKGNSVKGFDTFQMMIKEGIINKEGMFNGYVQVIEDNSDIDRLKLHIRIGGFDIMATKKLSILDDLHDKMYKGQKMELVGIVEYELDKVKMNIVRVFK